MRITITKGRAIDRIDVVRGDGSEVATSFPHKGPIPHDSVHLAVERRLGLADAFWGKVDQGAQPEAIVEMAKLGGHASASRNAVPDASIVEMVQAERLVECFEADLWSGGGDNDGIRWMAAAGWEQSQVPPIELSDADIDAIRAEIAAIAERWRALGTGEAMTFDWAIR